jgi:hypothetical protein
LEPNRVEANYRLAEVDRAQGKQELVQKELNVVAHIHQTKREKLLNEISGTPANALDH